MFGRCKSCEVLKEQNRYLQKIIDSLLKHVGAEKVLADHSLADKIPEMIEDQEGSDDPATVYGE